MRYMVQLDGLRALAVGAVLLHHYLREYYGVETASAAALAGVKLFFVLSGFLITGILLRSRRHAEESGEGRLAGLKRFYARRFLRIFPLYYTVIAVTWLLAVEPARRIVGWLLTYTLNIHMGHQDWFETTFAHFWSLSVEEQFYVVWPWFLLWAPPRSLMTCTLAATAVPAINKIAFLLLGPEVLSGQGTYIYTWACLDSLGAGAIVAMLTHQGLLRDGVEALLFRRLVPGAALGLIAVHVMKSGGWSNPWFVLDGTLQSVVFCWLVGRAARGFSGIVGWLLQWSPITYVGKISYGLYVYHPMMPPLLSSLLGAVGLAHLDKGLAGFVMACALALALSTVSWFVLERPFNHLKTLFDDEPRSARAVRPGHAAG